MSKVHKRKEAYYHRTAKKTEHSSPESGHDPDQHGSKVCLRSQSLHQCNQDKEIKGPRNYTNHRRQPGESRPKYNRTL
jgi:hypothetical protein